MKNLIIVLIFTVVSTNMQHIDNSKASKIFLENLKIIKQSTENKSGVKFSKISDAILFFEQLTHIKSESIGNFIGRFNPTKNDYHNWKRWFKVNRNKLYWDNKENKVAVIEGM